MQSQGRVAMGMYSLSARKCAPSSLEKGAAGSLELLIAHRQTFKEFHMHHVQVEPESRV